MDAATPRAQRRDRAVQCLRAEDQPKRCRLHVDAFDDPRGHPGRVAGGEPIGRVEHAHEGVRRVPVVLRHRRGDLRAAVAEVGPAAAGLDDRHPDAEWCDLLGDGFDEAFDAPLRRVVERVAGKGDLSAVRRDLDDPAGTLCPQVGQRRADEVDRTDEVGRDDVLDLGVGRLLGRAEQPVAGVADEHVDAPEVGEGPVHGLADRGRVGHVEHRDAKGVRVAVSEVGHGVGAPDGADYAVAADKELLSELAAEAAADAGDEPGSSGHFLPSLQPRARAT